MLFEREQYAEAYEYVRNVTLKELKKDVTGVVVGSLIKLARYEELFSYYNDLLSSCADAVIPFITNLEQQSKLMEPGERLKLYQAFSSGDDTYSLLNKIRASFYGDQSYEKTWEFITRHIDDVKLDTSADFYGDIIYFLLKIGKPASHILSRMRQETLDRYFEYLIALHDDLIDTVTAYLAANSGGDAFSDVRARKILCRYVLLLGEMTDEQYRLFFTEYIDSGIRYMKMLYNENVLSDRLIYDVKNDEETFIIYMHSALSAKDVNVRECMSFLKRALKAYPSMAKGINLILDEVKAEYDKQRQFEDYKSKVKDNIRALIESGCIKDAEDVIANYEEIVSDDVEIYSMKAVIAITMGRYAEAESVIDKGLALDGRYFDLWYDKGYLYEMQRRYADAADAYEKARDYCGDGMLSDMDELIERMRGKRLI